MKDLKYLIGLCEKPEQLKYIMLGLELFQKKGQDFTEEVSSLFVKSCIKHNDPLMAVNLFLKINRRISAWQTASSVHRLIESVRSKSTTEYVTQSVNLLGVLSYKGVKINEATIQLVTEDAAVRNDPILNTRMERIIRRNVANPTELLNKYPTILSNQAKQTKGMIDSLDVEEEEEVASPSGGKKATAV